MHPIICKIGPFTVYSYGFMLSLGFGLSLILLNLRAKKENINADIIVNFSFTALIWGIIGARIFYIIENIRYYIKNPLEIIMLQHGGLSWFGGLLFGVIFSVIYLKKRKLSVRKIFDLCVPFAALAQAVGRVGCLLNGCCFGKVSKFGLYFDAYKSILIPIQLYSSLALILIFIILRFMQDRPHKEGEIFFTYLLLYCAKRFVIEFWRADNEIIFLNLTLFQIISIAVFFFALIKLILIRKIKTDS